MKTILKKISILCLIAVLVAPICNNSTNHNTINPLGEDFYNEDISNL